MRWYVHGTDAATGNPITLALEHNEARDAVQAAMAKGILVTHTTKGPRLRLLALAFAAALCLSAILAGSTALFHWREAQTQHELDLARADESRLAIALTESGGVVTQLQHRTAALEQAQGGKARELVDQLEAARQHIIAMDAQLAAAHTRLADLEKKAAATGLLSLDLAAAQSKSKTLESQLAAEKSQVAQLEKSRLALLGLEKTNNQLLAQVDILKTQLMTQTLDQAAKSSIVPVAQLPDPAPAETNRPQRWALKTPYDKAADFLNLHCDKDAISSAVAGDGAIISTGLLSANATTFRILHDAEKSQVYNVTLTVSLAPDGPKEKLAQNQQLLADFIKTFAPTLKQSDAFIADTIKDLALRDSAYRLVRIGEDYKLSVWNNRFGVYAWKIESPRADMGD